MRDLGATCSNCANFKAEKKGGECRAGLPIFGANPDTWPKVSASSWCSQHESLPPTKMEFVEVPPVGRTSIDEGFWKPEVNPKWHDETDPYPLTPTKMEFTEVPPVHATVTK